MIVVRHRVNSAAQLAETPAELGVEVDLRCDDGRLVVRHDPVGPAEDFDAWLSAYRHAMLIANIKEEGLAALLLPRLAAAGISEFFLLDQTAPYLVKTLASGEGRCAVRVSEYESPETARALATLGARWVWLDCFVGWPRDDAEIQGLMTAGLRVCLVSPELHSPARAPEIAGFRARARRLGIDAVCTKRPSEWALSPPGPRGVR